VQLTTSFHCARVRNASAFLGSASRPIHSTVAFRGHGPALGGSAQSHKKQNQKHLTREEERKKEKKEEKQKKAQN
jgi:hypothetical protein